MFRSVLRVGIFLCGATLLLDQLQAFEVISALPVGPNRVLTALLLGLALLNGLLFGGRIPSNRKTPWLILFYFSLAVSSVYAVVNEMNGVVMLLRWTRFISMFLFYFLLIYVINSRRDLDVFLASLLVSGLIAAASAFFLEGEGGYYNPVRRSGIGAGQNQAAGNLLMVLPFVFALGYRKRSLVLKAVLFGCASALVAGFTLALSRSAFLAALAMGAMLSFRMRRLRDLRIVFAALALVLVAYLVAPEGYTERLKSLESIFDSTERAYSDQIRYRADIYKTGLIAFAENPVIGVGTDRFVFWAGQRDARMIGTHEIHNAVLQVAANQGLLGLVPYMALLVLTFLDFSRVQAVGRYYRYLQDEELEQIYFRALAAQVGFIGILTVAMFQPGTFWRGIWAFFAVSTILVQLTRKRLVELGVGDSQNGNRTVASENPTGTSFDMNPGEFRA